MHVGKRLELEHERLGRASEARERAGDHERQQLVLVHVIAQRERPGLVLADRLEHLAEGRMDRAVDQPEPENDDAVGEVVHRVVVIEVDDPEKGLARDALQAVLAAGERRLQVDEVQHLRERERDHREVDPLAPDRERPHQVAEHRGSEHAREDAELGRETHDLGRMAGDVARGAEEHRVAERKQAGEAEQQVEGGGEQREAQRLHEEDGVHQRRRDEPDDEQHRVEDLAPVVHAASFPCRRGRPAAPAARSP